MCFTKNNGTMKKDLKIFNQIVDTLLEDEKNFPVATIIDPSTMYESLDLTLQDEPIIDEDFKITLEKLVLSTPKTATNLFFNQLFGGRNSKAILGELLSVMLNNSMYTYKVAGPQVGVEKSVLKKTIEIINYGNRADGTFAAGGSMTNLMAMIMARDKFNLDTTINGVQNKMTFYTSEQSHYSIPKNASFIGVGRNAVRYIKTDKEGKMDVIDLENQIKKDISEGFSPVFVNATAATTLLGAYDPVEKMNVIAKKYNLWLHVDGAYGGAVIYSKKYKHLLKGLEEADSFSFNAHKMLGTPLSTSVILVKNKKYLYDSFANEADYLYQTDGDELNLGKSSLQCGRRNDALKFWTLWKSVGTTGLEKMVDQLFYLADVAREYVSNHPDYTLYSFDDSMSVCFNYKNHSASELCTALYEKSKLMVGYGKLDNQEFIRLVTVNSGNSKEDILRFFAILEEFVGGEEVES